MSSQQFVLDQNLREFATERQWEVLTLWEQIGSARKTAKQLGVSSNAVLGAHARVKEKAARRGYSPDKPVWHVPRVPVGFMLRGQSALIDDLGNLRGRWDKTKPEGMAPEDAYRLPDPKKVTKVSTMTDADGRVVTQWRSEKPTDQAREQAWLAFAQELSSKIERVEPVPAPGHMQRDDILAGYPVGDHHMGMLSWAAETGADYDINIGEKLLKDAMLYLSNAVADASQAIVAFLGDFMHYDSFESVTPTSRNALDSDTRFPKMVRASVRTMRHCVDMALVRHGRVHVIVEVGNHDLASSIFLAECLRIAYENEPRVTIDTSPAHYHYFRFGKVLLGTHHGHGTKMQNLPLTMAADRPEDWGATEHRHFWTGHIHTSKTQAAISAQDYSGCTVESFRILPPPDAWAHQKGYRSIRDMKAIMYHREHGEVARHTVNPAMLEDKENDLFSTS